MPITLITGPANAGKAELVMDAMRSHLARGQEPILVVPTRADAEHYLRELAGERAAIGVRVERFAGLVGEAVRRAGIAEPVIGGLARERLLLALAAGEDPQRSRGAQRGFVRALSDLLAELQFRRIAPGRLLRALEDWRAADGADAAPLELGRIYGGYRDALRAPGAPRRRAAGGARARRAARAPGTVGAHAGPVLRLRRPDDAAARRDRDARRARRRAGHGLASLRARPGGVRAAARAPSRRSPPARRARRASRAEGSRRPLRARTRAARSAISSARCSSPARRASTPGRRFACSRAAASAPSSSWWQVRSPRCCAGGWRRRRSPCSCAAAARSTSCSRRSSRPRRSRYAIQRRRPFGDTAIGRALLGLLRCVPAADGAELDAPGEAGELGDLLAWLRAPGLLELPALADRLELRARRAGARSAAQGESAVGGAPLAAGVDRPPARGAGARSGRADRASLARALLAVLRAAALGGGRARARGARRGGRARGGAPRARRAARARADRA